MADIMTDIENPKFRTVKYCKHGTLTENVNFKTGERFWVFEGPYETNQFDGGSLIDVLDSLSEDGYELVTASNDEYILRTKEEIEEVQEYYEVD